MTKVKSIEKKFFFNHIACDWDKEHRFASDKKKLTKFSKNFNLTRGDKVLDIGCGTGRLAPFIIKMIGKEGLLIEADFSEEMLKICSNNHFHSNLYFIQSNAHMIAIKENFFDTIICMALFPHLENKLKALKEFHRILRSRGSLIISHQMSRKELNSFHKKVKGPVTQDLLPTKQEMKKLLSNAGFSNISIKDEQSLYIARAAT